MSSLLLCHSTWSLALLLWTEQLVKDVPHIGHAFIPPISKINEASFRTFFRQARAKAVEFFQTTFQSLPAGIS